MIPRAASSLTLRVRFPRMFDIFRGNAFGDHPCITHPLISLSARYCLPLIQHNPQLLAASIGRPVAALPLV